MSLSKVDPSVADTMRGAAAFAVHKASDRTEIIHLLLGSLVYSEKNQEILQKCGAKADSLALWPNRLRESMLMLDEVMPDPSPELNALLTRYVTEGRKEKLLTERSLMMHLLRDPDTRIDKYLKAIKLDRKKLISGWQEQEEPAETAPADGKQPFSDYLENLNEKAKKGSIHPIQGRNEDIGWLVNTLCQYRKKNAILIGPPGVGKTAIIEELALRITKGEVPPALKTKEVYALDVGRMVAGTKLRGQFEERMANLIRYLKQHPNIILFVDEIHTIMTAGNVTGSSLNAANMLKPALSRGELVCIGATTPDDVGPLEKDPAFKRRFQFRWLTALSDEETLTVLKAEALRLEQHYGVIYTLGGIKRVLDAANDYFPHQFNPDKSLTLLDAVGSFTKNKLGADIINTKAVNASLRDKDFRATGEIIAEVNTLFSQMFPPEAALALSMALSGYLLHLHQPSVLVLGAGQDWIYREIVESLAHMLHKEKPIFIDCEELTRHESVLQIKGSPPSYIKEPTLLEDLRYTPHRVVFLRCLDQSIDEVQQVLSKTMSSGELLENNGRKLQVRHALFIVSTSTTKNVVGYGQQRSEPKLPKELLRKATSVHLDSPQNAWVEGYIEKRILQMAERVKGKLKVAHSKDALSALRCLLDKMEMPDVLKTVEAEILNASIRQERRLVLTADNFKETSR